MAPNHTTLLHGCPRRIDMRLNALLVLSLTATLFAGCLDSANEPETTDNLVESGFGPNASGLVPVMPDPALFVGTIVNDHATEATGHVGHQIPELHEGHLGLELAGHNDLSEGLVGYGSGYIEVDVVGDMALVSSVLGSRGVTLVDVSDPANMKVLSHIYNMDDNWDARLSGDGKFLFLGCQGSAAFECTGLDPAGETPTLTGGGPCTSFVNGPDPAPETSCDGGIAVYSLEDPTAPAFVDYVPMGFTHNVYTFMLGPKYYFMNAVVTIAEWDPLNGTTQIASTEIAGVHDIVVQEHPITGQMLLYTGSSGYMSIWDVSDPFLPALVGNVEPAEGESIPPMWHEQTPLPCLVDGRHLTIGAGEDGGGEAAPVAVVDTTDPTNPVYLGKWELPDSSSLTGQMSYRFSLHNIDANCDGQVAIGHYHAGVWVFDISTPERMANPATLAYYQPHERSISPAWSPVSSAPIGAFVSADTSNVWAAMWSEDGKTLFIPDMSTGLYALTPTWEFEA